jgi:hypothetical protein
LEAADGPAPSDAELTEVLALADTVDGKCRDGSINGNAAVHSQLLANEADRNTYGGPMDC